MEHIGKSHLDHLYGDMLQAKDDTKEELMKDELHVCTVCNRAFRLKSVLEKHKETHLSDTKAAPAPAPTTPSPIVSPTKTAILQQQQHASAALVAEVALNKPPPQQEASSLPTLQQPLQNAAMQQLQSQERGAQKTPPPTTAPKTFPCKHCDKAFTRELVLKMHVDMAHGVVKKEASDSSSSEGDKKTNRHPTLPGTTIYIRSQQQPTQPAGLRPQGPATFLNTTASRILAGHHNRPGTHAPTTSLQNLPPRPRLPVGLPPLALAAKRSSNGSFKNSAFRIKSNGGGSKTKNGMPGAGVLPGHDSSSEDDEGIPRHANVIMKRIHNDDDDADWTSRVKRVNVGADGVRTSSRIRTKKDRTTTEAAEEKRRRLDEAAADSNGSNTPKSNGHSSGKEIVPITRPYEPAEGRDRSAELVEVCVIEGCERKFFSYQSMMRHVAFKHQAERTMFYMKLSNYLPDAAEEVATNGHKEEPKAQETVEQNGVASESTEPKEQETVEANGVTSEPTEVKEKVNGEVVQNSDEKVEKSPENVVEDAEMKDSNDEDKEEDKEDQEVEVAEKTPSAEEEEKASSDPGSIASKGEAESNASNEQATGEPSKESDKEEPVVDDGKTNESVTKGSDGDPNPVPAAVSDPADPADASQVPVAPEVAAT